jgi:hypothetical protein
MSVSWHKEAVYMRQKGYTYAQIGKALGRSHTRVHRVLNPKEYPAYTRSLVPDSEETKKRRLTRRWCRRHAARLGKTVEELYARYGVSDLDRSVLWEERNG